MPLVPTGYSATSVAHSAFLETTMNWRPVEFCYSNGKAFKVGDTFTYNKTSDCLTCGTRSAHHAASTATILAIEYDADSRGFCETGQTMRMVLNNGKTLFGDTENGF